MRPARQLLSPGLVSPASFLRVGVFVGRALRQMGYSA
jgi:hypothetical protein